MIDITRPLTTEEIDTYDNDGVVVLRNIIPLDWIDRLRDTMQEVFDRERPKASTADDYTGGESTDGARSDMAAAVSKLIDMEGELMVAVEDGRRPEGRSIVETAACSWHAGLRDLHVNGPLPPLVAALTNSHRVNLYSDQLFLKEPGSSVRTPWHQDQPFWVLQGTKVAVCWVPVDEVTLESGAMGYIRGSHKWNITYKPSDFVTEGGIMQIPGQFHDDLADLPPIAANPEDYDIVRHEAGPGDCIVHHWMTLHGSTGNTSANRMRRAASVRFAGDDVTFYQRPSSPDPFRHSVALADGDDLDGSDHFPRVWPR